MTAVRDIGIAIKEARAIHGDAVALEVAVGESCWRAIDKDPPTRIDDALLVRTEEFLGFEVRMAR